MSQSPARQNRRLCKRLGHIPKTDGRGHPQCARCGEAVRPREAPSYHDLFITTDTIGRTSIFNLPFGIAVHCTRVGGWELWDHNRKAPRIPGSSLDPGPLRIAGEYSYDPLTGLGGLRLDVAGHVICDSLTQSRPVS